MDKQLENIKKELKNKEPNINYCVSEFGNIQRNEAKGEALNLLLENCDIPAVVDEIATKYNGKFNDIIDLIENSKLNSITTKKVKVIGMYYPRLTNGGIERVVEYLTKLYVAMGYRVVLITDTPSSEDYVELPKNAKRYDLTRGQSYKQRAQSIKKIVNKEKIDTIIYHAWLSGVLSIEMMLYKALGVSFIVHSHGVFSYLVIEPSPYFSYMPKIYSVADAVICLGDVNYAFWSNFNRRVFSVSNPPTFDIKSSTVSTLQDNTILWVGRISPEKKPYEALLILAEVCQVVPNTKLKMVGKPNSDKELVMLQNLALKLGVQNNVEFCGFHEDVSSFFLESSVFISTSKCEGFGLSLLESITFGVPIVLYELPYLTISKDSKGMFPVKFGDHKGAANEIIKLFNDRELLVSAGLEARNHALELADYDYSGNWKTIFQSLSNSRKEVELGLPQKLMWQTFMNHYSFGKIEKENYDKLNNVQKVAPKQEISVSKQPVVNEQTSTRLSLVFICKEENIKSLSVALVSILENSYIPKNISVTILCENAYKQENTEKILTISDKYNCVIDVVVTENINKYTCEEIAKTVSKNLNKTDKCIYLDCNVVVQKDLNNLFSIQLNNFTIGGVIDAEFGTISASVLLIDCAKIRELDAYEIKEIDLKFNLRAAYFKNESSFNFGQKTILAKELIETFDKKQLREALRENVIFSYSDEVNPLNDSGVSFNEVWWKYYKLSQINKENSKHIDSNKVSVIVPIYNAEKFIQKCVLSIINQHHSNIEIILVNSGSTDKSGEICDILSHEYSNIILIHENNNGLGNARNIGLDIATGDYICFMECYDFIHPETFEFALNLFDNYSRSDFIQWNCVDVIGEKELEFTKSLPTINKNEYELIESIEIYLEGHLRKKQKFTDNIYDKIFKHEFIKEIRFDRHSLAENIIFTNKIISNIKTFVNINTCLYCHYILPDENDHKLVVQKILDVSKAMYEKHSIIEKISHKYLNITLTNGFNMFYQNILFIVYQNNDKSKYIRRELVNIVLKYYEDFKINNLHNSNIDEIFGLAKNNIDSFIENYEEKIVSERFKSRTKIDSCKEILESYKKKYSGKRCFIIGNGPSLVVSDLDKLKDEFTFASNRIHLIYDKTNWRPNFYCTQDIKYVVNNSKEISDTIATQKILFLVEGVEYPEMNNVIYGKVHWEEFYPKHPKFSNDASICVYDGHTVTYSNIQLACYMGFTEIYLLGVDNNFSNTFMPDGSIKKVHGLKDHFCEEYENIHSKDNPAVASVFKTTLAYETANKYANFNGIKIYNATRGGKLEAFERIDFDSLF